jgi:transcriptional regulator with XRE-family HTH domain
MLVKRDMTQKELAMKVGITETTVSRYVSSEREPRISVIKKIAEVLDCSVEYLFYGSVEETVGVNLQKYWVVQVIHGVKSKSCIHEKEFDHVPSGEEIAEVLMRYQGKNYFVTVNENYRLED